MNTQPINPRHRKLPLAFVRNTYLACVDREKRSYWKRVVNVALLERLTATYGQYADRDFRFQRDMVRQVFCRLAQDCPEFRHFIWHAHERMLEGIDAAEWDWFRSRNVG